MKEIKFTKPEINHLIISIIIIGSLIALIKYTKDLSTNLILMMQGMLLIAIAILPNILAKKIVAKKYETEVEYRIWSITEKKQATSNYIKKIFMTIPIGLLLPILIVIVSQGKLLFLAFGMFIISKHKTHIGKQRPYLTEFESAKIAFIGPITNLLIALIFKLISPFYLIQQAIDINLYMAIYHLLPLPNLDGLKIFMAGRTFYIFTITFTIIFAILLKQTTIFYTVIMALVLALAITIIYLMKIER